LYSPNKLTGWRQFLGIPYKHLGRDWKGLDCYGLLKLYAKVILGIELKDWWYEEDFQKMGKNYIVENYVGIADRVEVPKKHDVILMYSDLTVKIPNHVGILVEEPNKFIQALKGGVMLSNLYSALAKNQTEGYYRLKRNG
jgi:murein DD-endopeptidase